MAAASPDDEELSQNIRDQFLQCKICLDGLKEPKTLPCLHTFCADCIYYYIGHSRLDDRKFACPICRRHIYIPKNGVDSFPDSFFVSHLNDMVLKSEAKADDSEQTSAATLCGICKFKDDKIDAKTMCVECKINLCETCSTDHSKANITKEHTLLPVKTATSGHQDNYCRVHKGESIKFYCETCNCAICLPCTFIDHKEHEIVEIKQVQGSFTKEMEGLVLQSSDNILQLEAMAQDLSTLESELLMRKETIKYEIRKSGKELIKDINEQTSQLNAQVDEYFESEAVKRDSQQLERIKYRMRHAHDFAKQLLSEDTSPIAQLMNRKVAKQNLEESLHYGLPDVTVHHEKLDRYINFLPGTEHYDLGSLLKCTNTKQGCTINDLQEYIPSNKAMFLHKLRPVNDDYTMGEVLALAFLPSNDIVVLTAEGKKVKIYNMKGQLKIDFGDDDELDHPTDMTITADGDIAITDCDIPGVTIFSQFGTINAQFGNDDVEIFTMPISITTDSIGRFLILDQSKKRITIHTNPIGELLAEVNVTHVQIPEMIHSNDGKIYISDYQNNEISIYTLKDNDVTFVAKLTTHGEDDGHFLDCAGSAIDSHGNLLIADMAVDRIHCIKPRGCISYITASGGQFMHPTNIAVSPSGLLAVAQQGMYVMENQDDGIEELLEIEEAPQGTNVCLYRLVKSDV